MALACDLVVASDTAKFIQVFRNVGLAPDGGAIYFLTQILGAQQAKEIVYSARAVPAREALDLGLVVQVVPDAELEDASRSLAESFARGPRLLFRCHQETIQDDDGCQAWKPTSIRGMGAGGLPPSPPTIGRGSPRPSKTPTAIWPEQLSTAQLNPEPLDTEQPSTVR